MKHIPMTAHTTHGQPDAYKWLVLALAALTFIFVAAIPQMSLPVLSMKSPQI
jgi:hypothetical protein